MYLEAPLKKKTDLPTLFFVHVSGNNNIFFTPNCFSVGVYSDVRHTLVSMVWQRVYWLTGTCITGSQRGSKLPRKGTDSSCKAIKLRRISSCENISEKNPLAAARCIRSLCDGCSYSASVARVWRYRNLIITLHYITLRRPSDQSH